MVKKIYFTVIVSILFVNAAFTQIHINPGVDTTDAAIREAIQFYSNYLQDFKGRKVPDFKKYWSEENCSKYKVPDPAVYGIAWNYPTFCMGSSRTIFYAKPLKDGLINLKLMGTDVDSTKRNELTYITSQYIAKQADGKLQLIRPIEALKEHWMNRKVSEFTFYYPKHHKFNLKKAKSLIDQTAQLRKEWTLKTIPIGYYFADTYEEIQVLRGFEYTMGMGNSDKPMGISNQDDNTIFCAGNGENYFHEVVHLYLNPLHPKSPLNEGVASYYGGTLGHPITWHIPRLKDYLNKHPEINLNKLEDFYYMDNFTNPTSAIQGMICKIVFDKDGISGLKRLMSYSSMNEVFEKELKLDSKQLNSELRNLINNQ